MLRLAMGLLLVALVATMFGAGGILFATETLRTLFYLFVVILLVTNLPVLVSDRRNVDEFRRDPRANAASRA